MDGSSSHDGNPFIIGFDRAMNNKTGSAKMVKNENKISGNSDQVKILKQKTFWPQSPFQNMTCSLRIFSILVEIIRIADSSLHFSVIEGHEIKHLMAQLQ